MPPPELHRINAIERFILRVFRVPPEPQPPSGSDGSLLTFHPAAGYYNYLRVKWVFAQLGVLYGYYWERKIDLIPKMLVGMKWLLGKWVDWFVLPLEILVLVAIAGGMIASLSVLRLEYIMRWYMVTDRSLRIRFGIFTVREMTMNFANIQEISITQGPIQRLFKVSELRVRSAGGSVLGEEGDEADSSGLHSAVFAGVSNPVEIREIMNLRLKKLRDGGLGDTDEIVEGDGAPSASMAETVAGLKAAAEALRMEAATLHARLRQPLRLTRGEGAHDTFPPFPVGM